MILRKKGFFILNDQWLQVTEVVVITRLWTSSSQFSSSLRRPELYYFHISQISPNLIYFSAFSSLESHRSVSYEGSSMIHIFQIMFFHLFAQMKHKNTI